MRLREPALLPAAVPAEASPLACRDGRQTALVNCFPSPKPHLSTAPPALIMPTSPMGASITPPASATGLSVTTSLPPLPSTLTRRLSPGPSSVSSCQKGSHPARRLKAQPTLYVLQHFKQPTIPNKQHKQGEMPAFSAQRCTCELSV